MGDLYTLDVVVGPKSYRHIGEIRQYADLTHFKTTLFTAEGYRPDAGNVDYEPLEEFKLLPDFLAQRFVRKPYGPVSFVGFRFTEGQPSGEVMAAPEPYSFASRSCVKLASKTRSKLVVSSWETLPSNPLFHFPPYIFNFSAVREAADLFIVPTALARSCLREVGVRSERIRVVRPGIDIGYFSLPRRSHEGFRVLFVGRLDPEKGVGHLLAALGAIKRRNPTVELWLCGPTRSGGAMVDLIRTLSTKLPIKLLGELPHPQLREVYAQCDVLCLPSVDRWKWGLKVWEEQFGWTLVESMASGLPIVATRCGAIPEVVGPDNVLVEQGSSTELAEALLRLAADDSLASAISQANRRRASDLYEVSKQRDEMDRALLTVAGR